MDMPYFEGYELIIKAREKELEHLIWQKYLVDYNRMDQENYLPYDEYKNKILIPAKIDIKQKMSDTAKEEIYAFAEDLKKREYVIEKI